MIIYLDDTLFYTKDLSQLYVEVKQWIPGTVTKTCPIYKSKEVSILWKWDIILRLYCLSSKYQDGGKIDRNYKNLTKAKLSQRDLGIFRLWNFYKRFIKNFGRITPLLTSILQTTNKSVDNKFQST